MNTLGIGQYGSVVVTDGICYLKSFWISEEKGGMACAGAWICVRGNKNNFHALTM